MHRDAAPPPTPGVVKQDKSSGGSVDTTKTRSGPQRVRMSSGERPIGAAKGKQSDTEALCHTPPTPGVSHPTRSPPHGDVRSVLSRVWGLWTPSRQQATHAAHKRKENLVKGRRTTPAAFCTQIFRKRAPKAYQDRRFYYETALHGPVNLMRLVPAETTAKQEDVHV